MTYERFLEIKEQFKDIYLDEIDIENCEWNIECFRLRFESKGTDKNYLWEYLINDFNGEGNEIFKNQEGIENIICFVRCNVFNEEEWREILPHIFFEEFNKDYEELMDSIEPLLGKIYRWREDLHLEFWQGIFSFGSHWCVEGLSPKESINSPENGEKYCNTLLEMYPLLKSFLKKHPYAHSTLMDRIAY